MADLFILGSQSPDRKQLMENAGLTPLIILPSDYSENDHASDPVRLAEILATKKGEQVLKMLRILLKDGSFLEMLPDDLEKREGTLHTALISADTIVVFKSEIFGKARNEFEAFATLSTLQGQTHKLLTGYHLRYLEIDLEGKIINDVSQLTDHSITKVKFSNLTDSEIKGYLDSGEWKGRAGCYAIQYQASQFVQSINGSHTGVIGLPIPSIVDGLESIGMDIRSRM